jgi:exodeoxyribonuclease V gamma subunit
MRLPEARAEARTLALRLSVESSGARVEPSEVLLHGTSDRAWLALAEHLGLAALPEAAPPPDTRVVVPMSAIVKFLEFPLQGWARFRVGLDEVEDEDIMAREDEPFETGFRDETMLLRGVVVGAAAEGRTLEQAYDEVVHDRELRGQGPSGVFAQAERAGHLAALEIWRSELQARDIRIDAVETHRFGRAGELARAERVHDAVALDVDVVDAAGVRRLLRAEIGGRTLPLGADGAASLTLLKRREKKDDEWARAGRERGALRAFVDHAVLSASGVGPGRSHASVSVVVTPEGAVTEHVSFAPLSRDEATVWLRGVVRDLLGRSHAYFLPCEAVFVRARRDPEGPLTPRLKQARELLGNSDGPLALRSAYGPVPRPHEYPSPDEQTARAMVERRFGLFFASQVAR